MILHVTQPGYSCGSPLSKTIEDSNWQFTFVVSQLGYRARP